MLASEDREAWIMDSLLIVDSRWRIIESLDNEQIVLESRHFFK